MRIDMHTHSDRSDGTDHPRDLVIEAAAGGLDVVALTDHDTAAGWDEARRAAIEQRVGFVPGIEISCTYDGVGVHLLAYMPDPTYEPLRDELAMVLEGRTARLPAMLDRLASLGIDITVDDVRRLSRPAAALGRPHLADALVAKGVVADRAEAFARLLSPGRPAYVDRYAADLVTMLRLVREAGGVSVVAHPWGRHSRDVLRTHALEQLAEAGLTGIEVDHLDHDSQARVALRDIAGRLGLVMTGSSDYHGAGKLDCPLGGNLTAPEQFEALRAAAASAGQASHRVTPALVLP